jgi:hypothetical protein
LKLYLFALLASSAFGQTFYSYYGYGYYTNAGVSGVPDSQLSIVNPGSAGVDVCANVYVLDAQNDIRECGSCISYGYFTNAGSALHLPGSVKPVTSNVGVAFLQ